MTTFPQLHRYESEVDGATIDLPLRGKVYTFPTALSFGLGLRMTVIREEAHRLQAALKAKREYQVKDDARVLVDDLALHELYRDLIGPDMWAEMQADGVKWPEALHVGETLFAYHQVGEEAAMAVWTVWTMPEKDDDPAEGDARPPSQKPAKPSPSSRPKTSQSSSKTTKKPEVLKAHK